MLDPLFTVRAGREDDIPLVLSSWVRSHKASRLVKAMGLDVYHDAYVVRIEHLTRRMIANLRCVVLTDDPEQVLAWALVSDGCLHYAYTKNAYRRSGFASELITATAPECRSHETFPTNNFFRKRGLRLSPGKFK